MASIKGLIIDLPSLYFGCIRKFVMQDWISLGSLIEQHLCFLDAIGENLVMASLSLWGLSREIFGQQSVYTRRGAPTLTKWVSVLWTTFLRNNDYLLELYQLSKYEVEDGIDNVEQTKMLLLFVVEIMLCLINTQMQGD